MSRETFRRWLLVLVSGISMGCRASEPAGASGAPVQPRASLEPKQPAVPSAAGPSAPSASAAEALPQLKPILKQPFPEGADEATVCEAIDSHEPDLWLRFGHIVPAYLTGAIYVLETGPETKDKLYHFIARDYVYGYHSQQAGCRGNLTLLYVRTMFDKSEFQGKAFGREHLGQAIQRRFGIKTRDSFQLMDDEDRLSHYCRADAELCDQLYRLDIGNKGIGLCARAAFECRLEGRDEQNALATCRRSATIFACLQFTVRGIERDRCHAAVTSALCPE